MIEAVKPGSLDILKKFQQFGFSSEIAIKCCGETVWNTGTNSFVKLVLFILNYLIYLYIVHSLTVERKKKRCEKSVFYFPCG